MDRGRVDGGRRRGSCQESIFRYSGDQNHVGESEVGHMKMRKLLNRAAVCVALLLCAGAAGVRAQNAAVRPRVTETVDDAVTVRLRGNIHPLAKAQFDRGNVP